MKNSKKTWILLVCYMAYTSIYMARLNFSVCSPELTASAILDKAQIGMIGSVFSVIYAVGRVINGAIGDKKSPTFMIATGLFLTGISNFAIGLRPVFLSILILWSCNAFAQSMLWSSILRIVSTLYDEQTAKRKTSVLVSSVATGNILGILFSAFFAKTFGLSFAFLIPGGLTALCGVLIVFTTKNIKPAVKEGGVRHSFFSLLRDREARRILTPALLHGVMKENVSLWMTVFFASQYGIDLERAVGFVLFIPVVGFAGRAGYLWLYKLCRSDEHRLSALCFVACILASAVLCLPFCSATVAMVCLAVIYAAISVANTSFLSVFPMRYTERGNVASVSGLMDFATYLGGGAGALVYGLVIEKVGFLPMFLSWAVLSALGGGILLAPSVRKK